MRNKNGSKKAEKSLLFAVLFGFFVFGICFFSKDATLSGQQRIEENAANSALLAVNSDLIHMYINTYVHMYINTYVHMYINTYVHMYLITYVRMSRITHLK
jgi:hypothetical protein